MSKNVNNPKMLSIVVTAHHEGYLLRPTLNSIFLSTNSVLGNHNNCEIIIVLDNADEITKLQATHFQQEYSDKIHIKILHSDIGDPGLSRNIGVENALGEFIALCDGDDLVSPNYFGDGLKILEASASTLILHAEYVLSFGARSVLSPLRTSKSDTTNYQDLIYSNLWPSASISQATTYKKYPYSKYNALSGYGPEDWVWNIETSAAGIARDIIPNSVYCYRTKLSNGVNNSHQSSILPRLDIKTLKERLPVKDVAVKAENKVIKSTKLLARKAGQTLIALSNALPRSTALEIQSIAGKIYRRLFKIDLIFNPLTPELISQLIQITKLEPAISIAASQWETLPVWDPKNITYTQILEKVLTQLEGNQRAVVWVPWLGIGGADMVALNYIKALKASERFAGEITLIATYKPERTIRNLIPDNVNFIQLPSEFRELPDQEQCRLIAQIFIQARPELSLSINCFDVTNALGMYASQMTDKTDLFLSLFAFDHISNGYPVNPITDDAERNFLYNISGILTDNFVTKRRLDETLGLPANFVKVHKQPVFDETPMLNKNSSAYTNTLFSAINPIKLLWPHRLDNEKCPRTLIGISKLAKSLGIPIEISVYGQQVLGSDENLLADLQREGIKYLGPYQGGLQNLPYEDFHAMLLTSESEGMPLVVVQSMILGLPVIATNVGGIPDLIIQEETGFLTQSPDDIDGFIKAIEKISNPDTRRMIIEKAYASATSNHSWDSFITNSVSDFTFRNNN